MGLKNSSPKKNTIRDHFFAATSHDHRTSTSPIYIHPPLTPPPPSDLSQSDYGPHCWTNHQANPHVGSCITPLGVRPRERLVFGAAPAEMHSRAFKVARCTTGGQQDHNIIIIAAPNLRSGGFRTMEMVRNGIINDPEVLRVRDVAQHVPQVQGHHDNTLRKCTTTRMHRHDFAYPSVRFCFRKPLHAPYR